MNEDLEETPDAVETRRKKNNRRRSSPTPADYGEITLYVDERCNTCMHKDRRTIDQLLVTPNISGREIARLFGLSHQSVNNHGKSHLNYNSASIKRVIE